MTTVIKLLFDICFYYTLSGYFLRLIAKQQPVIWGVPMLIVSCALYLLLRGSLSRNNTRGASAQTPSAAIACRLLCCALPALIFVLRPTVWQLVQYAPACIYLCIVIWGERFSTTYLEFEDHFAFTGKCHALILLGFLYLPEIPGAIAEVVPYITLYILSGVYLMRTLRSEGRLSSGDSGAVLLAALAGAVLITLLRAPELLSSAAGFLYRNVIVWVITGVAVVFAVIGSGLYYIFAGLIKPPENETAPPELGLGEVLETLLGDELVMEESASLVWLRVILLTLLATVAVLVTVLILRRLLGRRASAPREGGYTIEQERLDKRERPRGMGALRPGEPRLAVRWYYRKYLREGVARGAQLEVSDTSECVQTRYARFFSGAEPDRLRELYIRARYSAREPVESAASAEAQQLWKTIKNKKGP